MEHKTHTLVISAERARGRTVHKFLGRQTRYPAYGAGPVREFTDYGTRARARTPPTTSRVKTNVATRASTYTYTYTHTHRHHEYVPCVARRANVYFK